MNLGIMTSLVDQEAAILLGEVLDAISSGFIPNAQIQFVFTDREENFRRNPTVFRKLEEGEIPLISKSSWHLRQLIRAKEADRKIRNEREKFDRGAFQIMSRVGNPDVVILLGYMLVISPWLCQKLPLLNLHPDIPGRHKGEVGKVIKEIVSRRNKSAGAMIHLVSQELDGGRPISYFKFSLEGDGYEDLWRDPRRRIWLEQRIRMDEFRREIPLVLYTLKSISQGYIVIRQGEVHIIEGGKFVELTNGLCVNLSYAVNCYLARKMSD
jgi:phosphoribosylglycinamide formyltransferase-1